MTDMGTVSPYQGAKLVDIQSVETFQEKYNTLPIHPIVFLSSIYIIL